MAGFLQGIPRFEEFKEGITFSVPLPKVSSHFNVMPEKVKMCVKVLSLQLPRKSYFEMQK